MIRKKISRRKGDTQWWIKVKEAIVRKKDTHKAMCGNSTEENKNKEKKAVLKAIKDKNKSVENCQN